MSLKLARSHALNDSHHGRVWDHHPPSQGAMLLIEKEFMMDELLKSGAVLKVMVENALVRISNAVFLALNPGQLQ